MRFGSLFAGIGGFDLGLERAGMECAWQVENDPYCNKVLAKHWPDTRRYRDVKEVHGILAHTTRTGNGTEFGSIRESKREVGIVTSAIFSDSGEDGTPCPSCLPPVDLICGGFPCQPFSVAGKQRGDQDDRHLWPEMFRIIQEVRPTWVLGENVAGIIRLGLDEVLSDLESADYQTQTFIIPACAVDAQHRRDRVWIVAHANWHCESDVSVNGGEGCGEFGEDVADTEGERFNYGDDSELLRPRPREKYSFTSTSSHRGELGTGVWLPEPDVGRVAHGVSKRVDRLRCLGNAVVPQLVEVIGRAIMEANKTK
jgi:DNA (cytosine-5)-methyltransferase 1